VIDHRRGNQAVTKEVPGQLLSIGVIGEPRETMITLTSQFGTVLLKGGLGCREKKALGPSP